VARHCTPAAAIAGDTKVRQPASLSTYRFDYGPSRPVPDSGRFAGPFALLVIDSVAL